MFKKTQTLEQMQAAGWEFSPPRPCSRGGEAVSWAAGPESGKKCSFDYGTGMRQHPARDRCTPAAAAITDSVATDGAGGDA